MPREQHRHGKHHKHHDHHDHHEHHHYRHGHEPAEKEKNRGHQEKSSRSSRSRSRKREGEHGGADHELNEKCPPSPVKSSTMPTMSPVTHHYHRQTMAMSESQHCLADTQLIRLNLPGQNGHGSAASHKYADLDSQRNLCKELYPIASYTKPDLSLDYRPKRQKTAPAHVSVIADEVVNGKNMHKALQQELEEKIQNRKRSQSVTSRAEKSYYNVPERSFDEKNESYFCATEHGIEPERLAPQVSRPPKQNTDQTSSNDTVFYDKELLSDLYREKENKCSDLSRTKRTRTKSETRGLSDENSPTMPSDNDQVINLLRGKRRPLEVDAREFRVLKEKLLREQQFSTNAKREQKSSKTVFLDKNRTESDIKISDNINGKLPGSERSKDGLKDEDVFWREQVTHVDRLEVRHEDTWLKSSRKSRRENYEIENKELKHKNSDTDSVIRPKRVEIKPSQEKHVSTKESEIKKRDSFPLQYTREEKEWLKEKLLEEFERQEQIQREGDVHTAVQGSLPMKDRVNAESVKENPLAFTTTESIKKNRASQKSSEDAMENMENGTQSKSEISPLEISPPCTCGQSPGSPERKSINHDSVMEVPVSALVRQPPRYKSIHHDGITEPSDSGPGLLDPCYGGRTKTPDTSLGRKGTKIKSSSSKDWAELIEMSRVSQDQFLSAPIPDTWDGHSDDRGRSHTKSPAQFPSKSSKESQNVSPVKKDSSRQSQQSTVKVSPSVNSRHSAATRERSPREPFKPSTMPRESSPTQNEHLRDSTVTRDHSPGLQSSESCDHFQITHEQASTKQNSRHSFSCDSSLPHSPPPYVHPKSCESPGQHKSTHTSQDSDNQRCSCQSCECRSSGHGHYTSDENIPGLTNGGFNRNGSLRSTECRSEGPFHPHGERGPGEGPFHIEDRGDSHHMTLEQPYRGDPLPLYPEMENARGKVNIVIFSGVKLRRQHWCFLALVLVVLFICLGVLLPMSDNARNLNKEQQKNLIAQLLTEVPLIDGHNDLPWNIRQFIHNKLEKVNLSENIQYSPPWSTSKWSHTDFLRMRKGQVGAQLWTAYAPCGSQHKDAVQITLEQIDLIKRLVDQYSEHLQLAQTAQEIIDAHKNGRIASVITVESGHSIGTSLGVLRTFQRLGVRALTLTHNCDTPWADCSNADKPGAVPQHNGLTPFGKTVVQEMNRLGIVVDLSHTSVQTARDALAISEAPVIFSHSSAHAICNASRNVPDDILRIVAERKGLVMVNFFSYFLTCSNHSTLNDVIGHINHIRNIAGVDSVGIGASYDGINEVPVGLPDVGHYPELFVALLDSGLWAVEDIKKLAGLNFLRVLKAVEKVAVSMSGL